MGSLATRVPRLLFVSTLLLAIIIPATAQQPAAVPPLITQPVEETKRTVLRGNTHPLARPLFDRGAAPPDLPMKRMLLVLKRSPEQEHALLSLLDNQQDKGSPNYHKWVTPETFGKQFGPADEDVQKVTSWLESHGFQIGRVAKGKNIVEFSGVARQVQEAFHISIHKYVVNGEEHWANANDPEIPTALTPVVVGVHTLHNFLKKPMLHVAEQKVQGQLVKGKDGKPYVTFPGTPPLHALGPADFATIYDAALIRNATGGGGMRIAIVGRSNINLSDVNNFNGVFGQLSSPQILLNGPDPGDLGGGEEAEATLDLTWSQTMAPAASVTLTISASTNTTDGVDLSEASIVDDGSYDIMSESFGGCEAARSSTEAQGIEALAEQAAAQGITYVVASGDAGAEGCDNPNIETVSTGPVSVNILAATPFNIAVGGTMFNENGQDSKYWSTDNDPNTLGSALSYIPEDVWNESCSFAQCEESANISAGGGGASTFFAKPSWQSAVPGIPNDGVRDVPDVSLTAAGHDPYLLCLENSCVPDNQGFIFFAAVSGTSASTPAFAGLMALIAGSNGGRQGNIGYVLYKLASTEQFSHCNGSSTTALPPTACIFNDVTVGNNAVPGEVNYGLPSAQYASGVGYDLASGLGSVNVGTLSNKWSSVSFRASTTTLSMNPTNIAHGQPVNFTITVAPSSGTGTPTGDVELAWGFQRTLGMYTLSGGTVSGTVNTIPGGAFSVYARYAGDAVFGPSFSQSVPFAVTTEPSTTTLSAFTLDSHFNFVPFTGGPYGSFAYLRADVNGQSGFGAPIGTVSFNDSAGTIPGNPYALNNQGNAATPNYLNTPFGGQPLGLFTFSVGQHSVTASYPGDNSFDASTSAPTNLTIMPAPVTTVATGAPAAGKGATLTATLKTNSGGIAPTGTVTFYINDAKVGSTTTGSIVAPAMDPKTGVLLGVQRVDTFPDALADGTYTVKVVYSGDSNYASSTSPAMKFTVQPDFTFSADATTINISSPGKSGNSLLHITALDGYNGTMAFAPSNCSGLPPGGFCAFSANSVTGGGPLLVTILTTPPTAGMLQHRRSRGNWLHSAGAIGLVAAIALLNVPMRRRQWFALVTLALFAVLIVCVACGGGSGGSAAANPPPPPPPPPTPVGNYTVVVTATSGSLIHKVSLTLNVE